MIRWINVINVKDIEKQLGREEKFRWGPRIIDIDILSYDDIIIKKNILSIPHPELHNRKFVLIPLAEIAPYYIHPIKHFSIQEMLQQCPDEQVNWYESFNL